jgi:aspartyl protease family protein
MSLRIQYIFILLIMLTLEGCMGCSKSGRLAKSRGSGESGIERNPENEDREKRNQRKDQDDDENEEDKYAGEKIRIRMEKEDGVYKIPVKVNGTKMYFIFDTGAGLISISNVEASFLYRQGKLTQEDVLGTANFIDANGDISEGTIIMLKEVNLGGRTIHNVQASVVDNAKAPLLLGQSALEKFGKVSIDYNRGEITFE